jgi:DNA helicase-2/ATP-dependent DNA helicase PcrA
MDAYTYIEAAPGSGKTTVAAERFGILRFSPNRDDRAVVAVSFTRSATAELGQRIRRRWGPSALAWPHRVVTLDTVLWIC